MKIKINAIIRGSELTQNPGDVIEIEDILGRKLIDSGAAEKITVVEVVEVVIEPEQVLEEVKNKNKNRK